MFDDKRSNQKRKSVLRENLIKSKNASVIMAKKILLYRTENCPWCHKAAEFFDKHKVKYKSIDVGEDAKAAETMVEKSGQRGVPVIDIDGQIIVGYDEPAFRKVLKIK